MMAAKPNNFWNFSTYTIIRVGNMHGIQFAADTLLLSDIGRGRFGSMHFQRNINSKLVVTLMKYARNKPCKACGAILTVIGVDCIEFVRHGREVIYEYEGSVNVIAQAQWDQFQTKPAQSAAWKVRGTVKLQRIDSKTLAGSLAVEKISVSKEHGNAAVFYQNKEMQMLYNPFKIIYGNDTIAAIQFKATDTLWSRNFKRAIASTFQLKNVKSGAFVENEPGIHGDCATEYYVTSKANGSVSVRKNPVLYTCVPNSCGIHSHRSNVLEAKCFDGDSQKIVIVGNEAMYDLAPYEKQTANNSIQNDGFANYYLNRVYVEGNTMLQTFESTGESQLIVSKLNLVYMSTNEIVNAIEISDNMSAAWNNLIVEEYPINDITGERQKREPTELIKRAISLLDLIADSMEDGTINFDEPYEHRVVEVIRIFSQCSYELLESLYQTINVGSSYRQETVRNLFFDIIPRTGTKAAVMLTRHLIMDNLCKPTMAVQLLIILPFHITELSADLVAECEPLSRLGIERPDVRQIGILSFATIVHNTYSAKQLTESAFDKYVRVFFNQFLDATDYEQKLLYLQALGNLKFGKVTDYLDPIIRDETQSDDIRFVATWIKESVAEQSTSNERRENYETFWPIFENRSAPLELRAAAFIILLTSNPTSARLMSIHTLMESEPSPHLVNFYRTTLLSLAGTTQPCYQKLRRLASSIIRHLPKQPAKRYWVTGNYIFDYRSTEYGLGASLQTLLIGNGKSHLPQIAFFKLKQEALGKYTNQLNLYIKARGLDNVQFGRIVKTENGGHINLSKLREILSALKMPTVQKNPVHLEIIVQIEGKTIFIFFVDQRSFNTLTEGDMLNRIMNLLHMDSHINLQSLRWPFYTRYSVPTVLGTPTSLTVQNTALSSLRGNITQWIEEAEVIRSHQIDIRHSTFTVVTSKSYNPFLNMEHSINREQGFVFYLPINNELKLNWINSSLWFSFYRPNDMISGISLKSRTRTITQGKPLHTNEPYSEIIAYEGDPSLMVNKLLNYEVEDLGLMVNGLSNSLDVMSHVNLMFHMEPSINTFVYHEMEPIMKLWGLLRVNDIHIGTNKKFTLLFHNTQNTKLEGTIALDANIEHDEMDALQMKTIDILLEHKNDDTVLHRLSTAIVIQNVNDMHCSVKCNQMNVNVSVAHTDRNGQLWMLTGAATYEPIVFLKQPYLLSGNIKFGPTSGNTISTATQNITSITFGLFANILQNSQAKYDQLTNIKSSDAEKCPREILKFSPPPQNRYCGQNVYRELTTIHDYGVNVTFANSPQWLEHELIRLDYLFASITSQIDLYHFIKSIDAVINTHSDRLRLNALVNGRNVSIPNLSLWFNRYLDAKYDRPEQMASSIGYAQMCSVISTTVSTFDDKPVELTNYTKPNCSVLLVADCSIASRFALFVKPTSFNSFALELHIDDHVITYEPQLNGSSDTIRLQNSTVIEVLPSIRPFGDAADLKVYTNAENLLSFELFNKIVIQYYRGNILTVNVPSTMKANLCGICSLPFNAVNEYHYCS